MKIIKAGLSIAQGLRGKAANIAAKRAVPVSTFLSKSDKSASCAQTEFASLKDAMEYAKKRILSALNNSYPRPREYIVVIDNKTHKILGEALGESGSVRLPQAVEDLCPQKMYEAIILHGHPEHVVGNSAKITAPISFGDFEFIASDKFKEVIAISSTGEYSLLRRRFDKDISEKLPQSISSYMWEHIGYMYPSFREFFTSKLPQRFCKGKETIAQIYEYCWGRGKPKNRSPKTQEFLRKTIQEIREFADTLLSKEELTPKTAKGIHQFWLDYAEELGVEYRTNFSHLT